MDNHTPVLFLIFYKNTNIPIFVFAVNAIVIA